MVFPRAKAREDARTPEGVDLELGVVIDSPVNISLYSRSSSWSADSTTTDVEKKDDECIENCVLCRDGANTLGVVSV